MAEEAGDRFARFYVLDGQHRLRTMIELAAERPNVPVWFELSVQVSPDPNPHPNLTLVLSLAPPLTCPAGSSAHSSCSRRQGDDRTKTPLPTLAQVVQDKPAANEALLHMQHCYRADPKCVLQAMRSHTCTVNFTRTLAGTPYPHPGHLAVVQVLFCGRRRGGGHERHPNPTWPHSPPTLPSLTPSPPPLHALAPH